MVATQSQRGQEKLSEREWEDHERESWGPLRLSQGQSQVHGEMSQPLGLSEPIVSERVSARQLERIGRDTVVLQEKGGGV